MCGVNGNWRSSETSSSYEVGLILICLPSTLMTGRFLASLLSVEKAILIFTWSLIVRGIGGGSSQKIDFVHFDIP